MMQCSDLPNVVGGGGGILMFMDMIYVIFTVCSLVLVYWNLFLIVSK